MNLNHSFLPFIFAGFFLPLCGQDSPPPAPAPTADAPTKIPASGLANNLEFTPGAQPEAFFPRLGHDAWALAALPAHANGRQWRAFGFSLLAIAAVGSDDQGLRVHHYNASDDRFARRIRPLGTWIPFAAMGLTWGIGRLSHNPGIAATGEDGVEAGFLSLAVVLPVKFITGRSRPSREHGASEFKPFSSGRSFFSAETALAFSTATVISLHTDSWWLKGTVFTLATAVGWSRRQLNGHWASDIVAGALLGIGVGRWTVHRHRPGAAENRVSWNLAPSFGDEGERGVVFTAHW